MQRFSENSTSRSLILREEQGNALGTLLPPCNVSLQRSGQQQTPEPRRVAFLGKVPTIIMVNDHSLLISE